jgi:putative spermidine/putrescine transport system permease protein
MRRQLRERAILLRLYCALVFAFLMAPIAILLVTSFSAADTVGFPPEELSLRWYRRVFEHLAGAPGIKGGLAASLTVSFQVAAAAALIATFAGVLAAYALYRFPFRGSELLKQYFLLPVLLPQLVTGIALLIWLTEAGLLGPLGRLILGHAILTLPYVVLNVGASLEAGGIELEEAAVGLGASRPRAFLLVTLPLIAPAVAAGAILAFVISLHTFVLSYFLYAPEALPLPIWIFEYMTYFLDPLLAALSTFLIALSLVAVVLITRLVGLGRTAGS